MAQFDKILIANRGEIALRVIRGAREMGIKTVAVHSTADVDAMHVRMADESVCIGPPPGTDSYLSIPAIIAACEITGAQAVHPGYGFLSENAQFVQVLEDHEITFIGPSAAHIRMMGDKITAKETAIKLGIPVVPGSEGGVPDVAAARKAAADMGYPVIIKATAGGGGRGMKVAQSEADIDMAFSTARSEAKSAFGNDEVYMEKYLQTLHVTSKFRSLAMAKAAACIWPNATVRFNVATRKYLKRPLAPASHPKNVLILAVSAPMPSLKWAIAALARSSSFMRMASSISSK